LKALCLALILVFSCLAAVDVAVYPGAILDDQRTKAVQKTTQDHSERVIYSTGDAFEKVDAFYKANGSTDVPRSRAVGANSKYVLLKFPGKKYVVQLSWFAAQNKPGTTILFQLPGSE
jgi:hypothetical protein